MRGGKKRHYKNNSSLRFEFKMVEKVLNTKKNIPLTFKI